MFMYKTIKNNLKLLYYSFTKYRDDEQKKKKK